MSRKKMILSALGGVGAVATFGLLFTVIVSSGSTTDEQLQSALSILDQGRWDIAGRIARDLSEQVDQEENGTWHYVWGVAALKSVEDRLTTPQRRKTLQEATAHLEKAQELGFPAGYTGKGSFYLGWCFFHTYRWDDTIDQLEDSPMLWPARRSDAFEMVVQAELRKSPPDFESAQTTLEDWKAIPGLSLNELAKIDLSQAQFAFLRDQPDECETLLAKIGRELPVYFPALVWRGRWRLEQAVKPETGSRQRAKLLDEAQQIFREAKVTADTPSDLRRQATFLSGKSFRAQNKLREALGTFSGIRQTEPQSAEAIAAGVEESEILVELQDFEHARTTIRSMLRNIEDLSLYNEKWISTPELKQRLLDMGRTMRDQGEYKKAIHLAEDIALAFPLADSLQLQGETYEQWGEELQDNGQANSLGSKHEIRQSIMKTYHSAADKFDQLARLKLRSVDYTDVLWRAITNYQAANNLMRANELLRDYIKFEERTKRPRGFLALGKNQMNSGYWKKALDPLQRCLEEYPDHPVSFDARLLAAQALSELNDLDEAVELLEQNLFGFNLHPTNRVWKDSLFELGEIVFLQADQLILDSRLNPQTAWEDRKAKLERSQTLFEVATQKLGEAASRMLIENDPRHYDARYLLARSLRLAAGMPQQMIDANPDMIESARRKLMQQRRQLLEQSLGSSSRCTNLSIRKWSLSLPQIRPSPSFAIAISARRIRCSTSAVGRRPSRLTRASRHGS